MFKFSKKVLEMTGKDVKFFLDNYGFECRIAWQTEESLNDLSEQLQEELTNNIVELNASLNQEDEETFKRYLKRTIDKHTSKRIKFDSICSSTIILLQTKELVNLFYDNALPLGALTMNPIGLQCTDEKYVPSLYRFNNKFRKLFPWLIVNKDWTRWNANWQFIDRKVLEDHWQIIIIPSYIQSINVKLYHPYIFNLLMTGNLIDKII